MLRTSIPLSTCGATSNPRSWQTSVPTPLARCRKPPKMAWTASAAMPHFASHFSATPVCAYDPPQPAIARGSFRCTGKGRKERCTPLTAETVGVLRAWMHERGGQPTDALFPTSTGRSLSRDAVALLAARHSQTAAHICPSLRSKAVSPHVFRHTAAMRLLHAGVDPSTIALWLGHERVESTKIYIHADQTVKERALARTTPLGATAGRYRPPDTLLAFLEQLR